MTAPSLQERLAQLPPEKRKQLLAELARRKEQEAQTAKTAPPIRAHGDEESAKPLSFAQRRLWFLDQFMPTSSAYNIPTAIRLQGKLDVPALETSLNQIIKRHLVLRQVYTTIDEEPMLVPHPKPQLQLSTVTVSEATLQAHIDEANKRPFDLANDLPIRARLLRLDAEDHVLSLVMHHAASDGWSLGVFFKELSALYNSQVAGGNGVLLPGLPIQYADFAQWQQEWLTSEVLNEQLSYWQEQLAAAPTTLDLPTDRPRPPTRSFAGAIHTFEIGEALGTAVSQTARQANVSLYMFLLAAFHIVLHRYTGKTDILIGSPVAGRNQTETEPLIGLFLNTIVIRGRMENNPTVQALLQQIRGTTLDAFEQQHVPFEKLVEAMELERHLSHNPLIQVLFNVHNTPEAAPALSGLTAEFIPTTVLTSKFDLSLAFAEHENGLRGSISYSTDLFDAATIIRLAGHFEQLLTGMVADLNQPIGTLPMMTAAEKASLRIWHDTAKAYPPVSSMIHLFEQQAERVPDETAIIFGGEKLSYGELNGRANQLAHQLRQMGLGREQRVGLLLERSLEMMVGLLGILKAGAAYVPLDPSYPAERIQTIAREAELVALVTHSALMDVAPATTTDRTIQIDVDWNKITHQAATNLNLDIQPEDLMYVLFTSGSTGKPKGVVVENRNYVSYFQSVFERMAVPDGLTYAVATTFATDLGSIMFWSALCSGGRVHIISYEQATDPAAFAAYFRQHSIDVLKLVPSHYDALQLLGGADDIVPKRLLILAGETSYWETVRQIQAINPNCVVQDHYGVTETTGIMLTYTAPQNSTETGALPKGLPLANTQLYILDDQLQPVPIGVPGEVFIGGKGVTRGYLNRPDLTAVSFIPHPFSPNKEERLYRTGDLAAYQPNGTLKLLGRRDFQVKVRGYRVELGEIESALNQLPVLDRCVVMAQTDKVGDTQLVAYIATQPSYVNQITADWVRQKLRETLPDYMVPAVYVFLDKMPINTNGKIDRPALKLLEKPTTQTNSESYVAPRTEEETRLITIWADVLDLPQVGIDDNFFDIGGESFKAIRVVRRMGSDVNVMDLFQNPTVRELANFLASDTPHRSSLLYELTPPIARANRAYTLVCVPYGGGSAAVYYPLAQNLPENVSLFAVDLPGHEFSRRDEPKLSLAALAEQCVSEIQAHVSGPMVLYGHCVGSALTVEIGRMLEAEQVPLLGIFVGGNFPAPRLKQLEFFHKYLPIERWTSSRMIYEAMRGMGGFTDVLDPAEQKFVIETMRFDVRQASDYYTRFDGADAHKLQAPICCVVAQEDPATEFYEERAADWLAYSETVEMCLIPEAGHYFLKHQAPDLSKIVNQRVTQWQNGDEKSSGEATAVVIPAHTPSFNIFLLVAFGQLISMIGTGLTTFTLGIWALDKSSSLVDFTVISIFALLPGILVSPIAGAIADRWDRRKVMIGSDMLAAVGTAVIALLLWTDSLQVWHIYITASIGSIANAFQQPAYIAAIAQLVPKRHLGRANGIAQLAANTGRVLSPLLGGVLYVTFSLSTIVLIDFLTFLFAVGTLLLLRFPNTLFRRREEPLLQEILGGWYYITKRPSLVAMVIFMVVYNFFSSFATVMITPFVLAFGDAAVLGTVMSAFGLGLIGGALGMSIWGGMRRRAEGMILFTTLTGISLIIIGGQSSLFALTIGLFTLGVFFALIDSHWQAIIQTKVGFALQGRVVSINQMLVWAMMPIGFYLSGYLADNLFTPFVQSESAMGMFFGSWLSTGAGQGIGLMLITVGVLELLWGLIGWAYKPLRFLEDALPDAIPDARISSNRDQLQKQADQQLLQGASA